MLDILPDLAPSPGHRPRLIDVQSSSGLTHNQRKNFVSTL